MNVSVSEFSENMAAFSTAVSEAIAETTTLSASDIHEVAIFQEETDDDYEGEGRRKLSVVNTILQYDVRLWSSDHDYIFYATEIASATSDGTLEEAIREIATVTPGAFQLAGIEVDQTTPIAVEDRLYERGHSVMLTGTQIAGLVIGIVLFCVLFALLVVFLVQNKPHCESAPGSPAKASAIKTNAAGLAVTSSDKYREP